MAALTTDRVGSERLVTRERRPLKGSIKAIKGGIAICDATGFYKPGVAATGVVSVGVFTETVDNTSGGDGAKSAEIEFKHPGRKVRLFANSGTNVCVVANRETACYVEDDQTVGNLATGKSKAGTIFDVTSEGVWVEVGV
jgi:hypothetical protein